MEIINQIGHLQHWGLTPATNFLSHFPEKEPSNPLKILLTGTSDIRHILKTLTDIDIAQNVQPKKIEIYFHETHKELLCRALLFLHIIHETNLNYEERIELFLDLYANALIKERNSRYLSNIRIDLMNFIHEETKKTQTPIKHFVKLKQLKFEEKDEMSEILESWSNKYEFDIAKLRDQRLRFMFKERYDYRSNLVDWDYNMLLSENIPILHFYHYKEWRLEGLAFEQRFSTYTEPNRTLASYAPGRKKQERTSCIVRGYWGDMVVSPYVSMGAETNTSEAQKELLFKKANQKFIGHSVELTEYNMHYWLQRIETSTTYERYFRDYYRTDEEGKKKLEQKEESKKKKKVQNEKEKELGEIKEEDETEQENSKEQKEEETKQKTEETEAKEKLTKQEKTQQDNQEDLDSEEEERRDKVQKSNAEDIQQVQSADILNLFSKYGVEFYPMSQSIEQLTKPKFKEFFDVIVCGFIHTTYLSKEKYLQSTLKKGGQLHIETARFLVPKKKEERQEIHQRLKVIANEPPNKEGEVKEKDLKLLEDGNNYIVFQKPI